MSVPASKISIAAKAKLSQTEWLKTTPMYSLMVLQVRNP